MKDIDIREWKEYVLEDLFDFVNSKAYHSKDVTEIQDRNSGINYVTRSKFNNGLKCRVVKRDDYVINPKGTISFGAENADFFYQSEEYITGNKMYYIDTRNISKKAGLFLKSILENAFTKNFSFTDGMVPDRIKKEKIKLPSKLNKKGEYEPDWQYMEDYINYIFEKTTKYMKNMKSVDFNKNKIVSSNWKPYKISDFFNLIPVLNKLSKLDLDEKASIPVYSSELLNNGIFAYTNKKPEFCVSKNIPFYLIFGDHTKSMNIVKKNFCVMDNVKVLIPKESFGISASRFITTVWKNAIPNLGYARHWSVAKKVDILLPTKNGYPDWKYIEDFMDNIKKNSELKLNLITKITMKNGGDLLNQQ